MNKPIKSYRFSAELIDKLKEIAKKERRTLTGLIEKILYEYLDEMEKK